MIQLWNEYQSTIQFALVYAIFALSVYLPMWGGTLSLAPISIGGASAYAGALIANESSLSIWVLLPIGGLVGTLIAAVLWIPLSRIKSHFFLLATVCLVLMLRVVLTNLRSLTGGAGGLSVLVLASMGTVVIVLIILMVLFARLHRSPFGMALEAVRSDESAARAVGISPVRIRMVVFLASGALAGIAGVLLASSLGFITPDTFFVSLAFALIAAVVLGGINHWVGAIIGALLFTILPEVLREVLQEGREVASGVVLLLVVILLPGGLVSLGALVRAKVAKRKPAATSRVPVEPSADERAVIPAADIAIGAQACVVDGIGKDYGGLSALNDVSFEVRAGQVLGVVGPNGAGKSTLLNIISAHDTPSRGTITLLGKPRTKEPAEALALQGVARTFQNIRLVENLSVLEQVMLALMRTRKESTLRYVFLPTRTRSMMKATRREATALLRMVGFDGDVSAATSALSYGQQRRVEIARALAMSPKLLLLDEPTAGMTRAESHELGQMIHLLRDSGIAIVLVEHNLALVEQVCDEVVVLNFGQLIAQGSATEALRTDEVQEAYLGIARRS